MLLLQKVRDLLSENFFSIANVDMTIMAQRPRIGPHIEAMRENIAEVLGIGKSRIILKRQQPNGWDLSDARKASRQKPSVRYTDNKTEKQKEKIDNEIIENAFKDAS